MSLELFFAHAWIIFPAAAVVWTDWIAARVMLSYYRDWRDGVRKGNGFDVSTNLWISGIVASFLNLMMFAVLDVGQATLLVGEKAESLALLYGALVLPALGYKGWTKTSAIKAEGKAADRAADRADRASERDGGNDG